MLLVVALLLQNETGVKGRSGDICKRGWGAQKQAPFHKP